MALGLAAGSTWIVIGGPDILARGADDVLKEELANLSTSHFFNFGRFSRVGGNGIFSGMFGVSSLLENPAASSGDWSSSTSMLSLEVERSAEHSARFTRGLWPV